MSASALLRALLVLAIGSVFLYAGIFNPGMMYEGATSQPFFSEGAGRLFDLGLGVVSVLFGLWIIRRQLRAAPQPLVFGTAGKVFLALAVVMGLAGVGYGYWHNAHGVPAPPTRHGQPGSPSYPPPGGAPAPAPEPSLPAGSPDGEPAAAPTPLPPAVPQAGGPAPAPAPLSPSNR